MIVNKTNKGFRKLQTLPNSISVCCLRSKKICSAERFFSEFVLSFYVNHYVKKQPFSETDAL